MYFIFHIALVDGTLTMEYAPGGRFCPDLFELWLPNRQRSLLAGGTWSPGQRPFAPVPLACISLGACLCFSVGVVSEVFVVSWSGSLRQIATTLFRLWLAWEWLRVAQDMSQRRSYIAAHNVLRVLAFGANMPGYSGQGMADELLVRM